MMMRIERKEEDSLDLAINDRKQNTKSSWHGLINSKKNNVSDIHIEQEKMVTR